MNSKINKRLKFAFVLKKEQIQSICKIFDEYSDGFSISTNCNDGVSREFSNLDDLFSFENSQSKRIKKLSFQTGYSHSENPKKCYRCELTFSSNEPSFGSIEMDISGEERTIIEIRSRFYEVLEGTKAWYSFLARINLPVLYSTCLTGLSLFSWLSTLTTKNQAFHLAVSTFVLWILVALCTIAALIFVGLGISKLQKRFFPIGDFAFGQGYNRYKLNEKIRWGVIVASFLTLAISIAIAFLIR